MYEYTPEFMASKLSHIVFTERSVLLLKRERIETKVTTTFPNV